MAIRGTGSVELPAYGAADAEHRVEKEILRHLPHARVIVLSIARAGAAERIVEEFRVTYRIEVSMQVEAAEAGAPASAAFRAARAALEGTRYAGVAWEVAAPGGA